MIRAGIGDSICRPTAQLDWLLSHRCSDTPTARRPSHCSAPTSRRGSMRPERRRGRPRRDARARAHARAVGLGMTLCGGSHPASQGEHLVSHYLDMLAPLSRGEYLHGEQVAVATLAMARLQERMLDGDAAAPSRARGDGGVACVAIRRRRRPLVLAAIRAQGLERRTMRSTDEPRACASAGRRARVDRPHRAAVASRIADVLRAPARRRRRKTSACDDAFFARAVREARFLRDRYTYLDLAGGRAMPRRDATSTGPAPRADPRAAAPRRARFASRRSRSCSRHDRDRAPRPGLPRGRRARSTAPTAAARAAR